MALLRKLLKASGLAEEWRNRDQETICHLEDGLPRRDRKDTSSESAIGQGFGTGAGRGSGKGGGEEELIGVCLRLACYCILILPPPLNYICAVAVFGACLAGVITAAIVNAATGDDGKKKSQTVDCKNYINYNWNGDNREHPCNPYNSGRRRRRSFRRAPITNLTNGTFNGTRTITTRVDTCGDDETTFYVVFGVFCALIALTFWYLRLRASDDAPRANDNASSLKSNASSGSGAASGTTSPPGQVDSVLKIENEPKTETATDEPYPGDPGAAVAKSGGARLVPSLLACIMSTVYTALAFVFLISCKATDDSVIIAFQWTVLPINVCMILRFVIWFVFMASTGHASYFVKTGADARAEVKKADDDCRDSGADDVASVMKDVAGQGVDTENVLPPWVVILLVSSFWLLFTAVLLWASYPIRKEAND